MKRIVVLIIFICLAMVLSADLPPQKMNVIFVPDSFVRVGFADDPVYNSVEPDYMAPSVGLDFYNNEVAVHTDEDNLFLYTQIFTTYPMLVEISDVKALLGTGGSTFYDLAWQADFTPVGDSAIMEAETVSSSDNVSENPPKLVTEDAASVDLSKPRTYCWNLVINLSRVNGELPDPPTVPVSGSMTVNVRSV